VDVKVKISKDKFQKTNKLQIRMIENSNDEKKVYDLEERTFRFAKDAALLCKELPISSSNIEYKKQLVRASGSVGANYIEANESISKKDFVFRIKICLKESKEAAYWLRLIIETNNDNFRERGLTLYAESIELKKIFCKILAQSINPKDKSR
jgi:four helix bundle protein